MKWKHLGNILFWLGLCGLVLTIIGGSYLYLTADTVILIVSNSSDVVSLNQSMFEKGGDVESIYGNPLDKATKVTLIDRRKIIRPKEDTSLFLYPVDKSNNENPLQMKSVWLFLKWIVGGFGVTALIGYVLKRK